MKEVSFQPKYNGSKDKSPKALPILILWGFVIAAGIGILLFNSEEFYQAKQFYLIPWVFLTGIVLAAPSAYLWYRKIFHFYHPLAYAAFIYFIPAFFVGGLILSLGISDPYYFFFIQDPRNNLPLTMIVVMLGYSGLSVGFFLPFGKKIGDALGKVLPKWTWETENLFFPGYILLFIGMFNTVLGYISGVVGYQKLQEIGSFDGIIFLMTLIWLQASLLLWLAIFRRNKLDSIAVITAALLIFTSLIKAFYAGNRGGMFAIVLTVMMAYLLAGRRISLKQGVAGFFISIFCIIGGMVYGTTFRNIKESETRIGMEKYTEHIFETLEVVSTRNSDSILQQGFYSLAERLDAVSPLAVVVSNYEDLAPYEESYGLDNNIWKDMATFFVPRVIWRDKPLASEPRKYGELYFNYGENSFTITPMGDLLRNFGIVGVPLGMMFLGFLLRILYQSLIENQVFSYWRTTIYFMLLTAISYESFFGGIIPYLSKVAVIAVVGIVIVHFFIKKNRLKTI
ncbi:MAG TPA: hypothetical protein VF692_00635 [Pyrinomonadaceae bacterium]|jgi:hypothetical protein